MITVNTWQDFRDRPEVLEKIDYLLEKAQNDSNNRMQYNYTRTKISFEHTLAISIAERNGIPFSYSSLMNRPMYKKSARVISRFYYNPLHKIKGIRNAEMPLKHIWRDHTIQMIEQQTDLAYKLGYDGVFISQHDKSIKFFGRMYKGLLVKSKYNDWNFSGAGLYKVCNGKDCKHMIIYRGKLHLKEA
jgi:hypothetical protein